MMDARESIAQLIVTPDKDGNRLNISWEMANLVAEKIAAAGYRLVPELKVLGDEEIKRLNEKWEAEYENVEMTDSQWETKRYSLIAQAQLASIKKQLGI